MSARSSREVWDAMAPGWDARHAMLERVARPVTERMLERLAPAPGQTVLDLASGSGAVGFAAAALVGPRGRVVLGDFSEAMVAAAARRAGELGLGNVDCRVLDAERLDLPDAAVDGVLCRWGYMLMGDPAAALAETRRALRPGGRLSCAVFAGPDRNPWASLPARALQESGGAPPPEPGAPGIFALADPGRLGALLEAAGFSEPRIEEVAFVWRFAGADDYWAYLTDAAGAIAAELGRLGEAERRRVRATIAERVAAHERAGVVELPAVSLVASARA